MQTIQHLITRYIRTILLALALSFGGASLAAFAPAAFSQAGPVGFAPPAVCATPQLAAAPAPAVALDSAARQRFDSEPFVRTELYFGSERPNLPEVSAEEFEQFLDDVITACFPDGLTLLTGKGQFRESDGQIVQETSFVLILLYPVEFRKESNVKIEAIRELYKKYFLQQSVLRVDDPRPVRVGF